MDQTERRLQTCFTKVFPELTAQQISNASVDSVAKWDSMASITLLSLVGEEFGTELDMDDFEQFTSYQGILDYLRLKEAKA
jgi:acyl carrier protein